MRCPHCAQEIADQSTTCSICGSKLTAVSPAEEDAPESSHRLGREMVGAALLVLGIVMFLGGAKASSGGTVGVAIVLFVIGMITFLAGRWTVAER